MTAADDDEVVIAYIRDRAAQYDAGSGSRAALEDVAAGIANGDHVEAFKHGELDDLIDVLRNARRLRKAGGR